MLHCNIDDEIIGKEPENCTEEPSDPSATDTTHETPVDVSCHINDTDADETASDDTNNTDNDDISANNTEIDDTETDNIGEIDDDISEDDEGKHKRRRIANMFSLLLLLISASLMLYALFTLVDFSDIHLFAHTNSLSIDVVAPNGDAKELFNSKYSNEFAEQYNNAGVYSSFLINNGYSKKVTVTVFCKTDDIVASDSVSVLADRFELTIDKREKAEVMLTEATGVDIFGITVAVDGKEKTSYVASESTLLEEAGNDTVNSVVLMSNVNAYNDIVFSHPSTLVVSGYTLDIDGYLVIDTRDSGVFTVQADSEESIKAYAFFAEAENCDVIYKNSPYVYGDEIDFFIYAKTFNSAPSLHNTRTVSTANRFAMLCSSEHYPTLKKDTVINLNCPDLATGVDYAFEINVPVTLNILCNIGLYSDDVDIRIRTVDSGDIRINIPGSIELNGEITATAPNCSFEWTGSCVPTNEYVAKYMNVLTFNGVDVANSYELGGVGMCSVTTMTAATDKNADIGSNVAWFIRGNTLSAEYSYFVDEQSLEHLYVDVVTDTPAGKIEFNPESVNADGTINIYLANKLTVTDSSGKVKKYAIETERTEHNIPVIDIDVEDGSEIDSKEVYKNAVFSMHTDNEKLSIDFTDIQIKGRGQSSWKYEKKPYKIKFSAKTSLLGMSKAKNYVLISSHLDKSLTRNYIASKMAAVLNNLSYAIQQYPVDLFVNGTYRGVYILSEKVEVKKGRVEVLQPNTADTGFLLELAGVGGNPVYKPNVNYFHSTLLDFVTIKFPDPTEVTLEQLNFIKSYFIAAEEALMSGVGYEEYIDVDSVIDWFILHELTFNSDCCFRRSTFFTKDAGGKIVMGPAWDFDLAFGNFTRSNENYESFASVGVEEGYVGINWINYFMEINDFRAKLRVRFDEIGDDVLQAAFDAMDNMESALEPSFDDNFRVWDISSINMPNIPKEYTTIRQQYDYIRDFLQKRYDWLDKNI